MRISDWSSDVCSSDLRKTEYILKEGEKYFRKIKREKGEGIVAKSAGSRYLPGRRSDQWLKIKTQLQQEAVIGGFTEPRGSRKQFGALILGVYQEGQLEYIGQDRKSTRLNSSH